MSLSRYPEYKDSEVEWLGEVPEHWEVKRLKFLCKVQTGDKDTVNAIDEGEYPFFVRSQTVEKIDTFTFDCEAVLTAGDGVGVGKVFHYVNGKFDFHQRVYMMNQFDFVTGKFFFWYLASTFHKVALEGGAKSTVDSLRMPLFMNFAFAVPPIPEQRNIVPFLDFETTALSALIAEQERLIELLKEKRQAVISQAVTKGLDPNVPMKDSGVEWLGEVPKHWKVLKFQRCVFVAEGQVNPEQSPYKEMILIAPNHIESNSGRIISLETAEEQGAESGKYLCKQGDVIYCKIRPALRKVCIAPQDSLCSADMYPLRPFQGLNNGFLCWFLLSEQFSMQAILESDRVAMPKINRESLKELPITLPPFEEQTSITIFLNSETAKIDELITEANCAIELLKERRSALISAAVTGQIDVRGWTKPEAV